MDNYIIDRFDSNKYSLAELEKQRALSFGFDYKYIGSHFKNSINNNAILAYVCSLNEKIIGGAYVSDSLSSLYIEQLFVNPKYQSKGIGTALMNYVLNDVEYLENKFNHLILYSMLEDASHSNFYKNMGYRESNNVMRVLKKRL